MRGIRTFGRFVAPALLLLAAACVDSGPVTQSQIDQDINSGTWMRNQMPPPTPGILRPSSLGDTTAIGP
jgi:hypothetical protein